VEVGEFSYDLIGEHHMVLPSLMVPVVLVLYKIYDGPSTPLCVTWPWIQEHRWTLAAEHSIRLGFPFVSRYDS
jgi:hypothetical protein